MSETKFTPGPWEYDKYRQLFGSNGKAICTYNAGMSYLLTSGDEEANANTILMKAAPEMYEALEKEYELLLFANGYSDADIDIHGKTQTSRIKRVLARARGES